MEIRAYDELYLDSAQYILGHAVDFAVGTLGITPDVFGTVFAVSDTAEQFGRGNPRYVAGMNGCELAREVLEEAQIRVPEKEDVMYLDRSPEYWAGWALAWYQWKSDHSFMEILRSVPLEHIVDLYPVYHEMDLVQFGETMDEKLEEVLPKSRLRYHRYACDLSQAELSRRSGVPLRQIQLFEQGQRDIRKTSAETLYRLSKALYCPMEALL